MADNENIKYVIDLQDNMSKTLDSLSKKVDGISHGMEGAKHESEGFLKQLLEYKAVEKSFEIIVDSVKEYQGIANANIQIENTLKNLGNTAYNTAEQLNEKSEELFNSSTSSMLEIKQTQQQLLTSQSEAVQRNINEILEASANFGAAQGRSLNESANIIKDIINRGKNVRALTLAGLGLNPEQVETILNKFKESQEAGTEALLTIINTADKGAAAAKLQGDSIAQLSKLYDSLKESIGAIGVEVLTALQPIISFVTHYRKAIIDMALGLGGIIIAIKTINVIIKAVSFSTALYKSIVKGVKSEIEAVQVATKIWNYITEKNPMLFIISLVVGALIFLGYEIYQHWTFVKAIFAGGFAFIKSLILDYINAWKIAGEIIADIFTGHWKKIGDDFEKLKDTLNPKKVVENALSAYTSAYKGIEDANKKVAKTQEGIGNNKAIDKSNIVATQTNNNVVKTSSSSVEKQTATNINIKIDSLIKEFQVVTNNLGKMSNEVKKQVLDTMLEAVRDSQILIH